MKVWGDGHLEALLGGAADCKLGSPSYLPSTLCVYLSFDRNHFISRHFPTEITGQLPRRYMVTATFLKKPSPDDMFFMDFREKKGDVREKTSIASICCPTGIKLTTEVQSP